ncbi:DUF2927 domain-containing protein [Octadecabacter sp. R77987]|uniref:DUF2927 domain-containing protein n=1 Tax=Octadecabacter sp. R77987 TaxID=3093874 RepID=UPI00366F5E20
MNRLARRLMAISVAFMTGCTPVPQSAPPARALGMADTLPPMRTFAAQRSARPTRPNAEIAQDFLDLSFRMESGRPIARMTRFEGPISVRVTGAVPASMVPDLRNLLGRFRSEAGIDIFMTGAPTASITIEAVPRAELQRAVPRAACFVVPRISSWEEFKQVRRTPQVDWTTLQRRDRAVVFVPADVAPQEIRDCLHEEIAQALGPLNDLYRLPDSVFNDDNIHAVLTGFDMLILRAYYAEELRNGMSRGEVATRLPAILARLNPGGQSGPAAPRNDTTRNWIVAMETALSSGATPNRRREAAREAITLAQTFRWDGTRDGFAHYAYGRLQVGYNPDLALASFQAAQNAYGRSPLTQIHSAHVAVQIAAFALAAGDADSVLSIVDRAIPVAAAHQNAALLATLMMFRAEALEMTGRYSEAEAVRLDSLAWARYGFGSERNVRARQREIAGLNPTK